MVHCVSQSFQEFVKVFFVQKDLVLLVGETIFFKAFLTLRYREIVIIRASRFHIKEIRPLTGLYFR